MVVEYCPWRRGARAKRRATHVKSGRWCTSFPLRYIHASSSPMCWVVEYRPAGSKWSSGRNASARNVQAPHIRLEYRLAASRWRIGRSVQAPHMRVEYRLAASRWRIGGNVQAPHLCA